MSTSSVFGMAPSLMIPIAATLHSVTHEVGTIAHESRDVLRDPRNPSRILALKLQARRPGTLPNDAPLWRHPSAREYFDILYAREQLWVHVDYKDYRQKAWFQLMYHVPSDTFLDHVQNRRSTRLRESVYPYIRLVPVPRAVNTNAGHRAGGEGLEFAYTEHLRGSLSAADWARAQRSQASAQGIVYADPFDLTKMLGLSPGTQTLDGVRDFQHNFFV